MRGRLRAPHTERTLFISPSSIRFTSVPRIIRITCRRRVARRAQLSARALNLLSLLSYIFHHFYPHLLSRTGSPGAASGPPTTAQLGGPRAAHIHL